jgi:hypothetical protein
MCFETHFTSVLRHAYIAHGLVLIDRPTCNLKQGSGHAFGTLIMDMDSAGANWVDGGSGSIVMPSRAWTLKTDA